MIYLNAPSYTWSLVTSHSRRRLRRRAGNAIAVGFVWRTFSANEKLSACGICGEDDGGSFSLECSPQWINWQALGLLAALQWQWHLLAYSALENYLTASSSSNSAAPLGLACTGDAVVFPGTFVLLVYTCYKGSRVFKSLEKLTMHSRPTGPSAIYHLIQLEKFGKVCICLHMCVGNQKIFEDFLKNHSS